MTVKIHHHSLLLFALTSMLLLHGFALSAAMRWTTPSDTLQIQDMNFELVHIQSNEAQEVKAEKTVKPTVNPLDKPEVVPEPVVDQLAVLSSEKESISDVILPEETNKPEVQEEIISAEQLAEAEPEIVEEITETAPSSSFASSFVPPQAANYLRNPAPVYPLSAKRRGLHGLVLLDVEVSKTGLPIQVNVKQSTGYKILDNAARGAVERWQFLPALEQGKAVSAFVQVPIRFALND